VDIASKALDRIPEAILSSAFILIVFGASGQRRLHHMKVNGDTTKQLTRSRCMSAKTAIRGREGVISYATAGNACTKGRCG